VEVDEPEEHSGCAGAAVISAAVLGLACGLWALSPTAFVLGLWIVGWGAIVWAARRPVPPTPNPAPPPVPERGPEEEVQVSAVRDTSHPNRWVVTRPSEWLSRTDKEAGTE